MGWGSLERPAGVLVRDLALAHDSAQRAARIHHEPFQTVRTGVMTLADLEKNIGRLPLPAAPNEHVTKSET